MRFLTSVQKDRDTQRWYFIVYDAMGAIKYRSEPKFTKAEDAEHQAANWVALNTA